MMIIINNKLIIITVSNLTHLWINIALLFTTDSLFVCDCVQNSRPVSPDLVIYTSSKYEINNPINNFFGRILPSCQSVTERLIFLQPPKFFLVKSSSDTYSSLYPSLAIGSYHLLYRFSESRGTMFMDCSSWKSSLHAYGIFIADTCLDDWQ